MANSNEKLCPECGSSRTNYVPTYGFWECEECGEVWGHDEDDPDHDEESLDLGGCCVCGCIGASVQNILMLKKKTVIPGTGWGCCICNLPSDGAIAVVCDDCLANISREGEQIIKYAVAGYATDKQRVHISELTEPFDHRDIPHE